ncbi:MAG: hypothetical protein M3133_11355, partial [Actinomycetota bacterium]|nr:hypothetical protein [Actinomycetota bacterium]
MRTQHGRFLASALVVALAGCAPSAGTTDRAASPPTAISEPSPTSASQPERGQKDALAYGVDGDIYVADWDGSNPVRIADGRPANECGEHWGGEYWGEGPIWSPDGRYLAYRRTNCPDDPWGGVVISDPEGNVIAEFPGFGWDISWSPDSTRVAVWASYGPEGQTIGVYGLDGVRQALLTMPP